MLLLYGDTVGICFVALFADTWAIDISDVCFDLCERLRLSNEYRSYSVTEVGLMLGGEFVPTR
ncbi:hypothetical protein CW368_11865 [Actinomycetales bacterium SN12]|nr:hypothetical protein CW368_11865 [Actinomycetales bacterium SN12]